MTEEYKWIQVALDEAEKALREGEIPVGAVIVLHDSLLAQQHNRKEQSSDATAHAEILAIRQAGKTLGNWRLDEACLYVTTEPCMMCWGAILEARIRKVVFASPSQNSFPLPLNKQASIEIVGGIAVEEARDLMRQFFLHLRQKPKKRRGGRVDEGVRLETGNPSQNDGSGVRIPPSPEKLR